MLEQLCAYLRNYFEVKRLIGTFEIADGAIDLSKYGIQNDQYFRIIRSTFNDGIYQYPASGLHNEVFTGAVWLMQVPPTVTATVERLEQWQEAQGNNDSVSLSSFLSESFGGYSYTRALGVDGGNLTAFDALAGDIKRLQQMYGKARAI